MCTNQTQLDSQIYIQIGNLQFQRSEQVLIMSTKKMITHLAKTKTKRIFKQPHKITKHLICCVCHDVFEDPVRLDCGHTFCYICIQNWALVKKKCPRCKNNFRGRNLEKDLLASQLIDDLQTQCTHAGCSWEGVYSLLKKHQRWCSFKLKRSLADEQRDVEILNPLVLQISSAEERGNEKDRAKHQEDVKSH